MFQHRPVSIRYTLCTLRNTLAQYVGRRRTLEDNEGNLAGFSQLPEQGDLFCFQAGRVDDCRVAGSQYLPGQLNQPVVGLPAGLCSVNTFPDATARIGLRGQIVKTFAFHVGTYADGAELLQQ